MDRDRDLRGRGRGGGRGRGRGLGRGRGRSDENGESSYRGNGRGRGRGRGDSQPQRGRGSDRGVSRGGRDSSRASARGRGGISGSSRSHSKRESSPKPSSASASEQQILDGHASDDDDQSDPEPESEPEAEVPIFERTSLTLASNPLPPLSTLSTTLSKFTNLHKLDLSYMQPGESSSSDDDEDEDDSNTRGIETLQFLAKAHAMGVKERKKTRKNKAKEVGINDDDGHDDDIRGVLGETLTLLNLSGNTSIGRSHSSASSSKTFQGLDTLQSLFVLNLSSCSLTLTPPRSVLLNLANLRALILSHNQLTTKALQELPYLPNLNTLVLSHNDITALPKTFPANFPALTKISISHNKLGEDQRDDDDDDDDDEHSEPSSSAPLPDFTSNIHLREVRISHNKTLRTLPSHIATWGKGHAIAADNAGKGLFLLDAGHCDLSWSNVDAVLLRPSSKSRHGLKNLTLSGNVRIDEEFDGHSDEYEDDGGNDDDDDQQVKRSSEGYKQAIRAALPGLSILDGTKLEKSKNKSGGVDATTNPSSKKRKRGDHHHPNENGDAADTDRRLANRAGPPPPTEADEGDDDVAAVDSEEEQDTQKSTKKKRKKSSTDKPDFTPSASDDGNDGKTKRAKRGKKKIDRLVTGSLGHVDDDDDDDDADDADDDGDAGKRSSGGTDVKTKSKSKAKSKDKATSESESEHKSKPKSKKRKPAAAWDEAPALAPVQADDAAAASAAPNAAPATTKGQTSIAGIIEVKKKDKKKALSSGSGREHKEGNTVGNGSHEQNGHAADADVTQQSDSIGGGTQQSTWGQDGLDLGGGGGSGSVWG